MELRAGGNGAAVAQRVVVRKRDPPFAGKLRNLGTTNRVLVWAIRPRCQPDIAAARTGFHFVHRAYGATRVADTHRSAVAGLFAPHLDLPLGIADAGAD